MVQKTKGTVTNVEMSMGKEMGVFSGEAIVNESHRFLWEKKLNCVFNTKKQHHVHINQQVRKRCSSIKLAGILYFYQDIKQNKS